MQPLDDFVRRACRHEQPEPDRVLGIANARFLQCRNYAQHYPDVLVKLREGSGAEILGALQRGEIDLAQTLVHAGQLDSQRFASHPLAPVETLAACHPAQPLGRGGRIDVGRLAKHPLLLLDRAFLFRRPFDAACRLAGVKVDIRLESRAPHALLALAEAGQGIAVIPSALRADR